MSVGDVLAGLDWQRDEVPRGLPLPTPQRRVKLTRTATDARYPRPGPALPRRVPARLSEIADDVDRTHERVHVTRDGRGCVALVAEEDLESLDATLELLGL